MNTEMMIKILSMGVSASFITGVFSLVISIKNNKRIIQIEDKKERFQMDEKRYELLNQFLKDFENIQFCFEKDGDKPNENFGYLKKVFNDSIDVFENIKYLHERKSYLFDDAVLLTQTIKEIDGSISDYVKKFENCNEDDFDVVVVEMDKICISIYELREKYLLVLRTNIEKILKRL